MNSFIIVCEYKGTTSISEISSEGGRESLLQWASNNKLGFSDEEISEIEDEILTSNIAPISGITGCYCCMLLCGDNMLLIHIIERKL